MSSNPLQDRPSRDGEFDDAYRCAGELLDASPHCQRWEAARCVDEPEKQIVRIEWDSAKSTCRASGEAPTSSPSSKPPPFFNDIEEMSHYQVTAGG